MSNTTSSSTIAMASVTSSGTFTGTTTGGYPCQAHGWINCNCNYPTFNGTNLSWCSACATFYNPTSIHYCSNHSHFQNVPYVGTTTGTFTLGPTFKEVKEITTDETLTYEWDGTSTGFFMKLPAKFSDCFIKVGYTWYSLYPLIFSTYENDAKELSFHLVTGIIDKVFEGDLVILKSVTTTKIIDNLAVMQLTERCKNYFNKDESK